MGKGKREGMEGKRRGRERRGGRGEFASLALGGIDAPGPRYRIVLCAGHPLPLHNSCIRT